MTSTSLIKRIRASPDDFYRDFNVLWNEHLGLTDIYVKANVDNQPSKSFIKSRLDKNTIDFANLMRAYYGEFMARKFGKLMGEHLEMAGDVVKSMMTGNYAKFQALMTPWYTNAEELAECLARVNYMWTYQSAKDMMFKHLDDTLNEIKKCISNQRLASAYESIGMTNNQLDYPIIKLNPK